MLGAYILPVPSRRVPTLLVFGFFVRLVHLPAVVVLGLWIVVAGPQRYSQFERGGLGWARPAASAWFAHIGGFLAGMALLFLMRPRRVARL